MKHWILINTIILLGFVNLTGCTEDSINTLDLSVKLITISADGGSATFSINTDAEAWNIDNPASDWVNLSITSGTSKTTLISILVDSKWVEQRTGVLTITAGNAEPVELTIIQQAAEYVHSVSANVSNITFKKAGNASSFTISTDATEWSISCDADWLSFDHTSGIDAKTTIEATAAENEGEDARTATIEISAQYAPSITINITQNGELYPNYNTDPIASDQTGMESTAEELAAKINVGWNLGNSLEAIGGETAWGNPATTQALIDLVNQSGFNAVRIPCSWNAGHLSDAAKAEVNPAWLARVKQVIQYCINDDMYVILNIHWDGGWLENNCTLAKQEENNAKQKAFWEQIATYLRDFDEHLLFASANEPNVDDATGMSVLKSYHQTFIDAVRSTGGKNAYRNLIIQGPSTDIDKTNTLMKMPTDRVPDRMMVEVHYYTPWNFCGMTEDADWGKMFYYWGENFHSTTDTDHNPTYGEEATVDAQFAKMKTQFIDNGYPVILGEYSASRRSALPGDTLALHLASRAYFFKYVTQQAKAYGILPFYWDNGGTGNNGCALFKRSSATVFDQQALDAIMEGAQ